LAKTFRLPKEEPLLNIASYSRGGPRAADRLTPSQIEQFFGWGKSVGGLRKTRLHGVERTAQLMWLTAAAYNLLRISRLSPTTQ